MNKNIYEVKKSNLRKILECLCLIFLFLLPFVGVICNIDISTVKSISIVPLLFISGIISLVCIILISRKRVKVWKNQKIEYCNGFITKLYKFSDIAKPKRISEYHPAIVTGDDYSLDLGHSESVYYFYTKEGKKLFKLNSAYINLDKLIKDLST